MRSAWKRLGVKSLFGKSQPGRSSQRGLTYTLGLRGIWAQCIVVQEYVFLLRRGARLIMHSLGKTIKQVVHSVTRGAYSSAQERSNVFQMPELLRVVILILWGEGAPETLIGASYYSIMLLFSFE